MKTTKMVVVAAVLLMGCGAMAQEVINLPASGTESSTVKEKQYFSKQINTEVVVNVTQPTLTAYLPEKSKANGTAVIIAPGGGFHFLSINSEGIDVAKWLNAHGVAGFVLKYRLVPTGEDAVAELGKKMANREQALKDMASVLPLSGADGLAAVKYVREHAEKYGVAPDRIGFMGFSAGGGVTSFVAFNYDAASRPNFVAPVYAGGADFSNRPVPADAPPMFVLAATDDQLGLAKASVDLYSRWIEAKKPAELHVYAKGGHGFGMRKQDLPTDHWIERFYEWMQVQKLVPGAARTN